MAFSYVRVARVVIASAVGASVGLYMLRDRQEPSAGPPPQVAVTEVSYNPTQPQDIRLRITLNGKRGYINGSGQVMIEPTYAMAMPFSEGIAAVADRASEDGPPNWRFVNVAGVVVIPRTFVGGQIGTFHEGLAPIQVNGKWGYIANTGETVIPVQFDAADDFSEGLAIVRAGRKYGVIDRNGKVILPPTHDFIGHYSNGCAVFAQHDQFGYLDRNGAVAIKPEFDRASDFSEGLAFVATHRGEKSVGTYVDVTGKPVFELQPINGGPFREGLAMIEPVGGTPHYIDRQGKTAIAAPAGIQRAGNFSEGLAAVMIGGRFGFMDRTGQVVIAPQWQFVDEFHRGTCRVNSADVRGYINPQGKYIWKLAL